MIYYYATFLILLPLEHRHSLPLCLTSVLFNLLPDLPFVFPLFIIAPPCQEADLIGSVFISSLSFLLSEQKQHHVHWMTSTLHQGLLIAILSVILAAYSGWKNVWNWTRKVKQVNLAKLIGWELTNDKFQGLKDEEITLKQVVFSLGKICCYSQNVIKFKIQSFSSGCTFFFLSFSLSAEIGQLGNALNESYLYTTPVYSK